MRGLGWAIPAQTGFSIGSALENAKRALAKLEFAAFDQLTYLGSFSLSLDASSLGGPGGKLQQLASGQSKSGLGASASEAVLIAEQALTHVANIEGLLDRAAARGADPLLELSNRQLARRAGLTTLATVHSDSPAGLGLIRQSNLVPRRVLDLLRATSS